MTSSDLSTIDLISRLVSFDTTSRNSNLDIIGFIEDYLDRQGVTSIRVDYRAGSKTNLYATIGPDGPGGIVLSGHTDVVPVDGQDWSSDPFTLTERNGALYGRGTADMKGFLAVALAAVPMFKATLLKRPIHLAFSCDEEVGCRGVRPLIQHIAEHLPKPAAVIVGEPTMMQVVDMHKTALSFETEVTGREAHSSAAHQGVNAIMMAGELIQELNRIQRELIARADPGLGFDPPYTTVSIGTITGGTAKNIVPRRCSFVWETRLLPRDDPGEVPEKLRKFADKILPEMKAVAEEASILTRIFNSVPGLKPDTASPALNLALQLTGENDKSAVSYATEAGLFQEAGMAAIICGPGSIEQAHKPNEFIARGELERCEDFMRRLAQYCARDKPSS
jgi:acetylornithine deacetylase